MRGASVIARGSGAPPSPTRSTSTPRAARAWAWYRMRALRPRSPRATTTALMMGGVTGVEQHCNRDGGHAQDGQQVDCETNGYSDGQSLPPVISRMRRWKVMYAHAHSPSTAMRFLKPISQKMWRKSQNPQASHPDARTGPISTTAEPRPIVATLP